MLGSASIGSYDIPVGTGASAPSPVTTFAANDQLKPYSTEQHNMKRFYSSALTFTVLAAAAVAQRSIPEARMRYAEVSRQHQAAGGADRAVIWQDDFSNPSNWVIGHDGTFNSDFEIGVGLESTGQYGTPAILSTTADNGYAMYNSDGFNNQTTTYEQAHITTAAPIDLSANPNVVIDFQTQYRTFNDEQTFMVISTDGTFPTLDDPLMDISGMPNVFRVWEDGELTQGVSPGNPTTRSFNISAVAGGQSQVWVRFQFTGIWGYAWYIDDVQIYDQYQYDARTFNGYISQTGTGEEFGRTPLNQLPSEMNVGCWVRNLGYDAITNVQVNCEVRDDATNTVQFTASTSTASLAPGDTLSLDDFVTLPPLALGTYTATFTTTSDQSASEGDTGNDTFVRTFEVTQDVYSLDGIGNHPDGAQLLSSLGTNSFTGGEDGFMLFTYYQLFEAEMAYGVEIQLANGSVAGGTITAAIHDTANVFTDVVDSPLGNSAEYTTTDADITSGVVVIPFLEPISLDASAYYAGIEMYSNSNTNDTRVLDDVTVPQPFTGSMIYIPGDQVYSNGNAMAIRLLFSPSIGMAERTELSGVSMYPNPAVGGLVTINAVKADNHSVEVFNSLGEVVHTARFGMNTTLDLSGLAKGVYTVRVSTATAMTAQLISVQ